MSLHPSITSGQITSFYLFDVGETISLADVPEALQTEAAPARLAPETSTPAYVQYQQPPLVVDGDSLQVGGVDGCRSASSCSTTASSRWR